MKHAGELLWEQLGQSLIWEDRSHLETLPKAMLLLASAGHITVTEYGAITIAISSLTETWSSYNRLEDNLKEGILKGQRQRTQKRRKRGFLCFPGRGFGKRLINFTNVPFECPDTEQIKKGLFHLYSPWNHIVPMKNEARIMESNLNNALQKEGKMVEFLSK